MLNELSETYKIIEESFEIKLGVGDKYILKGIIQNSKDKGLDFLVNGAQSIIREFSSFFPESKSFKNVLKRIKESENNAVFQWTKYHKNKNAF